jgi:Domain of Unknown Function with PDB structure (DUF3857)/Transglutaminase-like superfamily
MTHVHRLLCVVALAVSPLFAFAWGHEQVLHDATPQELAMKTVDFAPGAAGAILQWDHHEDDFSNYESEYLRIKIFSRDAAKYGDVELQYVPGYTWIKDVQARTIHADGTVVPFDGKMYDKLIVKASGIKVMAKTFSLPDIQPGSILEYYYVRGWNPNQLFSSQWAVQHALPVLKESIWIKPYSQGVSSFFVHQGLPAGKAPQKVADHFELALENMPALEEESYAPPKKTIGAHIDLYYTFNNGSVDDYWRDTGKDWAGAIEDFIGNRRYVNDMAKEVAGNETSADAKLHKLYARVQQVRNLSYEPDKTDKEANREKLRDNKSAEDVLRNGYGWRSEITRAFVALARGAGFDANVVRAASRDEWFFARNVPDSTQLDSEVAVVVVDGKPRYFDPGTPFAPYGILHWELTSVPGLKLVKKGGSDFVETPAMDPADSHVHRVADLRVDGDSVKGTVTITYTGEAALLRRLDGRNEDEAKNRKTAEDHLKSLLPEGSVVKIKSLGPLKASDEPLVAVFDVEMPSLGSFAGSRALLPLAVFSASAKNPFSVANRKHDIYFGHESLTTDEVTLHLPDGYDVESMPKGTRNDLHALVYKSEWAQNDRAVTFKRALTVHTVSIDVKSYPTVRSFYSKVATADQDNLVLKKSTATAAK